MLTADNAHDTGGDDAETGFLDVAANALAVVILATLFILIVSARPPVRGDAMEQTDADLTMPPRLDAMVTPLSAYYVATDQGIVELDLTGFVLQAAEDKGVFGSVTDDPLAGLRAAASEAAPPPGDLTFLTPRIARRDYAEYRAMISLDFAALRRLSIALPEERDVARFVNDLQARHADTKALPTFLVLPEALSVFAPIYFALRQQDLALRWYPVEEGASLRLSYKPSNFETRAMTW